MANTPMHSPVSRRNVLTAGALMTGLGMASAAMPARRSRLTAAGPGRAAGQIYRLQAAFHRAKSTQDIDLMMSLWDPHGTLHVVGDPNSPYAGLEQLKAFWLGSGSFTHRPVLAGAVVQDPDRRPRRGGVFVLRMPRRRGLRPARPPDRRRHVPRWHAAPRPPGMGVLRHDRREGVSAVRRPLLLPILLTPGGHQHVTGYTKVM